MDPLAAPRWAEIDALFDAALGRAPDERTAWLRAECGADPALYRAVAALLRHDADAADALGEDAVAYGAALFEASHREAPAHDAAVGPGTRLGPYRVEAEIGRGGMGAVYRAARADGAFDKAVALKLVKRGMDTDEVLRRFRAERQILAGLDHPHIARLLDAGAHPDGRPFVAMELVDGEPITAHADRRRLGVAARLDLFAQVCDAVAYAHRHLVVHRDLKPSNILVTAAGARGEPHVKLLDFGIARLLDPAADALTRPGVRLLTPEYAAPEQRDGGPITTATDAYALGVLLHELLAGARPAPGVRPSAAVTDAAAAARGTTAPRLARALRGDLDAVVAAALRLDPAARYASAEALADDLARHRAGLPLAARRGSRASRLRKFVGRHRLGVGAGALAAAAALAFVAALGAEQRATAAERDRAAAAREEAEAVSAFLEDVVASADPFAAERLDTLRVRDVLARRSDALAAAFPDRPLVRARLLTTAGRVWARLGDDSLAAPLLDEAVALRRAHAAPAAELAESLGELARVRLRQGDAAAALAHARGAAAGLPPSAARGAALVDLGRALMGTGALAAAEDTLRAARALLRAHGAGVPARLDALSALARVVLERERIGAAEALLREGVALRRAHYGPGHPAVAAGLYALAEALRDARRPAEAEGPLREALAIQEAALGPEHPAVATSLSMLASVLRYQERYDEAIAAYERTLALERRLYGRVHPAVASTTGNYASLHKARGDYARAEALQAESLRLTRLASGADHYTTAMQTLKLASIVQKRRDWARAAGLYRAGLAGLEPTMARGDLSIEYNRQGLGACLTALGRHAEAERVLVDAYRHTRRAHGPDAASTQAILESVVALYEAWGRPAEAAEYAARRSAS